MYSKVIYVKEQSPALTVQKVQSMVLPNVNVKAYYDGLLLGENPLVVTALDKEAYSKKESFVVIYEELMDFLEESFSREYKLNYNKYYLHNAMERAKMSDINTIVVGNSYFVFGIEPAALKNAVNCSLPSQDLFFSYQIIKRICAVNKNIRTVVLGGGYYTFHTDLSRSQNRNNEKLVASVYYPLFGDMNHRLFLGRTETLLPDSDWVDVHRMLETYASNAYEKRQGTYFRNAECGRARAATKLWEDSTKLWVQLTEAEKNQAGKARADAHNRALSFTGTLRYNIKLLDEIIGFCSERDINLVMAVLPASRYYREHLSPEFKRTYYSILGRAAETVYRIDYFDSPDFEDGDFNDMDHLGNNGAQKMTRILNEEIAFINEKGKK